MELKILTFNWHAPYIYLLSKMGHSWMVVEPEIAPGRFKSWEVEMRPIPDNVTLLSKNEALGQLEAGNVDLLLAHNIKDLVFGDGFLIPKLMTFHNRLSTEIELSRDPIDREDYLQKLEFLRKGVKEVYISENKLSDWGGSGDIIMPGIDTSEYKNYIGQQACVLRIGNHFIERDLMLGFTASQKIIRDLPCVTLGINPHIPNTELAKSFEQLKTYFQQCRVYLNTTVDGYEDGYNLSMLEAMATGMPVVSTANSTSPVIDGENGFISDDLNYLKRCVEKLLNDVGLARTMGLKARKTIEDKFSLNAFLGNWKNAIQNTVFDFLKESGVSINSENIPFQEKKKKNILMDYVSYPATTAHLLGRALRRSHNVITCGAKISENVIKSWKLENLNWPIEDQDIPRLAAEPLAKVLQNLPDRWTPDLYLWVETGLDQLPPDLDTILIPKACYLIDTHIHLETHLQKAQKFDFVFLAQKEYVEVFKGMGCGHVFWLPLGCDPEIHGKQESEKKYDVGFVGSLIDERRQNLLKAIDCKFDLHVDRKFMDEMARVFSESKIVFNNAINCDLNMRVFEALCSGSLLVTDEAVGLNNFFEDGKHLVIYRNEEELLEKIRFYLKHPERRIEVERQGEAEVLEKHTYDHRVEMMMEILDESFQKDEASIEDYDKKKTESYYKNVREDVLAMVSSDSKCILDIGCGAGKLGEAIKKRQPAFVAGVELNSKMVKEARNRLDDVVEGDIESIDLPYEEFCFDNIIMADILEHLVNPLKILKTFRKFLKPDGVLIASIPNVQFLGVIAQLVEGRWTYNDDGILDRDHLRFFTRYEIQKLFQSAGF